MGSSSSVVESRIEDLHVVIVGGGYGGVQLAILLLESKVPFTLIDPKEFFFLNVAGLRALSCPEWLDNTMIQFKVTFGERFRQASVVDVDWEDKSVKLSTGHKVIYTDLVFAVGSKGTFPGVIDVITSDEMKRIYADVFKELDKATNVVIIGGGPTGVELAGEIAERFPNKFVRLIHSNSNLTSKRYTGSSFQGKIKSLLSKLSIEVVTGRVTNMDELSYALYTKQIIHTQEGDQIDADIVFSCTGSSPEVSLTSKIFSNEQFDRGYRLKVTPSLNVDGHRNVYAIGDCCNTAEEKMAAHAERHAITVAHNILKSAMGQQPEPYKPYFDGMLVSVGSRSGAGIINGWNFPSWLVAMYKSRSLFVHKGWSMMNQKIPNSNI